MKKHKQRFHFCLFLLAFIVLAAGAYAVNIYADSIQDAKAAKERLETRKKETEDKLKELERDKNNIVTYIEKLDNEMNRITKEVDRLQKEKKQVKKELKETKEDLNEARKTVDGQYETMKRRIKYMYENGSSQYIEVILNAENMSDLLNRAEYISKISEYDGNLLKRFEKAKKKVEEQKKKLETKSEKLKEVSENLDFEQETVKKLVDKKKAELKNYDINIKKSRQSMDNYNNAIEEQEKKIEDMLEQERLKAEAERKRREEAAKNNQTNVGGSVPDTPVVSKGGFIWPLPASHSITCGFGPRRAPMAGASTYHKGIDIGAPSGSKIVAAKAGRVVTASYSAGSGNFVMISHGDGIYTIYMHASQLLVSAGTEVSAGTPIALVGSTGISTGPHLHFAVTVNGKYVNPLNYVR